MGWGRAAACTSLLQGPGGGSKPSSWGMEEPQGKSSSSGMADVLGERAGELGRFPSYHGGQLGNHVAQSVDVALVPRVGSAQVLSHLAELLLAGGSVVLWEKHTAQSMSMAQSTRRRREGEGAGA